MVLLKELQEEFLRSIVTGKTEAGIKESMIPGGHLDEEKCLDAYRNDYTGRLSSTLGDNFESLWSILGDQEFFELCADYIKKHPSKLYDLGDYGDKLPLFLKEHKLSYLSELANVEIQFRRLFNSAPPKALEPSDFENLTDPSNTSFKLSSNIFLSKSAFPLYKIWEKRSDNSEEVLANIKWLPENFLMYNSNGSVQVKFLSNFQHSIAQNLMLEKNLEAALSAAGEGPEAEVSELFSFLVGSSLILSFC